MSDFKIVSLLNPPVVFATGVITASAGTQSLSSGSLVFSNSNNVTFGMNGGTITASASMAGGGGAALSAGTNSTNTGTVSFLDSNGVSFGMNTNGAITATVKTDYQSSGAYLTTAMASNRGSDFVAATAAFAGTNATGTIASNGISVSVNAQTVQSIKLSAGTLSALRTDVTFGDSNGVSFGLNTNGVITATVKTDYQTSGNYLTTARASNDAIGLNTAQSNVTWTVNSNGLSLDARGYAGTATGATNASLTANSGGISVSVAAPVTTNGLISAINVSAGTTSNNLTKLTFSDSNGISFGLNGSVITATVKTDYLTTAMASNRGSDFVQATAAFNGTNISGTIASNAISLSVAAPGAAAENNWINLLGANTAGNTTASGSTIGWSAGNGLTLSATNGSQVVLSVGPYITTARASNDAIGLNTAQSNVTWTVNSSGISLDGRGYAGTATGATNASVTVNSNGVSVSVDAPSGGITLERWANGGALAELNVALAAQANSSVSLMYMPLLQPVAFSDLRVAVSSSHASAANNSSAFLDYSYSAVLYTRNGSTLSSINSGSKTGTMTWSSNAGGAGAAHLTLPWASATTLSAGEYWLAHHLSTTNTATGGAATTALGVTLTMVVLGGYFSNAFNVKPFGGAANNSYGQVLGRGIVSTGNTMGTVGFSKITMSGSRGLWGNVYVELRNYSI